MKVIIAGSRGINDYSLIVKAIWRSRYNITEVVSGTAAGVDRLGEQFAKENNIPIKKMPANWEHNGRAAGHIRNYQMAEYADAAIIVWDGKSPGTKNMIDNMVRMKKPYYVASNSTTLEDFI
jgi:hypothetical protein